MDLSLFDSYKILAIIIDESYRDIEGRQKCQFTCANKGIACKKVPNSETKRPYPRFVYMCARWHFKMPFKIPRLEANASSQK